MIDLTLETPLSLQQICAHRLLVHRNGGKGVTLPTVWRWATYGLDGVILETIDMGRLVTTDSALVRFFQQVNEKRNAKRLRNSGAAARASHDRAEKMLDAAGIA